MQNLLARVVYPHPLPSNSERGTAAERTVHDPKEWNCIISGEKILLSPEQLDRWWRWRLISALRAVSPAFEVDDRNRNLLAEIYKWVWAHFGYEEGKLRPDRGILLYGPIGTGKTTLMKGLQRYFSYINLVVYGATRRDIGFELRSSSEMALYFARDGMDALARWMERGSCGNLCIDEIGREEDAKFFGTPCNVVRTVLQMRYELRDDVFTLGTTNLDMDHPEEFSDRYGDYVLDRIKEMFNIVKVDGPSRRS